MITNVKPKNKFSILAASLFTGITAVSASLGHDGTNRGAMMWGDSGSLVHAGAGMMGYNMWGMGWFGLIPGLLIWTLVILGIVFLYQKITEESDEV